MPHAADEEAIWYVTIWGRGEHQEYGPFTEHQASSLAAELNRRLEGLELCGAAAEELGTEGGARRWVTELVEITPA